MTNDAGIMLIESKQRPPIFSRANDACKISKGVPNTHFSIEIVCILHIICNTTYTPIFSYKLRCG